MIGTIEFTVQMWRHLCMSVAPVIFTWSQEPWPGCPGPTRTPYLGQNEFISNCVCLAESGGLAVFPGALDTEVTRSTHLPGLADSHLYAFEPFVLCPYTQHSFVHALEWPEAREPHGSKLEVNTKKWGLRPRLCAFACSPGLPAGLHPGSLTNCLPDQSTVTPRGLATVKATCPTHPPLSQTECHPRSWDGHGLKFNHQVHGLGEFFRKRWVQPTPPLSRSKWGHVVGKKSPPLYRAPWGTGPWC